MGITNNKLKLHFMGISGSGSRGVADLASKMGYEVTGCDLKDGGHDVSHLNGIDLLIVSPAILYQNAQHPEFLGAKEKGIVQTWEEFLGTHLLINKKVIAISGTHGKSTTTAMAAKMLIDNGLDPIAVIGANVPEWGGSSRYGDGEYAVIEADEFNDNFLNYSPDILVINNVEFDHPDYFKDEVQVKASFEKLKQKLKGQKILIEEKDSLNKRFNLKVIGEHNQKNANMVYLLGIKLGIDEEKILKSIESFEGIGRRMQLLGTSKSGFLVFDDYAHHPTAIKTTLKGLRQEYKDKKIVAIIEPHGYKRTMVLQTLYQDIFNNVDRALIGPIYAARDKVDNQISSQLLAEKAGQNVKSFLNFDELINNWDSIVGGCDIVVVMGAGNSSSWAHDILKV